MTDPAIVDGLLLARRGQAYYSRKLNELSDADFDEPSLLPGWDRRHVIAHVGLNARAITRLTEWAKTGVETPMYDSPSQRSEEIDVAATLPAQALRNLSDHAAVHLSVEWRDLPDGDWSKEIRTALGRLVPVSETVWMRTREVWIHAVDLGNGGSFHDFPPALVDALLDDVSTSWERRRGHEDLPRFAFAPLDRPRSAVAPRGDHPVTTLTGRAADLASWATGRATAGVSMVEGGAVPAPPRWL